MRVFGSLFLRRADEHASSHPEMNDPLSRSYAILGGFGLEIKNDMLAYAPNLDDACACERSGNFFRRRFERFPMLPQPHRLDYIATNSLIEPTRDGFDLGKLGHWISLIGWNSWVRCVGRLTAGTGGANVGSTFSKGHFHVSYALGSN